MLCITNIIVFSKGKKENPHSFFSAIKVKQTFINKSEFYYLATFLF